MADQLAVKVTLEQTGEVFEFPSPESLRAWTQKVLAGWQWVLVPSPYQNTISQSFRNFSNQLDQIANDWTQNRNNESYVKSLSQRIGSIITQSFGPPSIFVTR